MAENKKKLIISFSGGRTSGMMMKFIWDNYDRSEWEIIAVFANTGKEAEGTLKFVKQCSVNWGIPVTWLEYSPNSVKGYSVKPVITSFATASRKGEPFSRLTDKLGVPSSGAPFCSTLLKKETIRAYARKIGWKGYYVAIGIRSDEIDRVSIHRKKERIIYPLIATKEWPSISATKEDVFKFWREQSFDLNIDPDLGNCDNCWKKNFNVLIRNAKKYPESFEWWKSVTDVANRDDPRKLGKTQSMYRMGMSVEDILFMAEHLTSAQIKQIAEDERLNGCGGSCEAF